LSVRHLALLVLIALISIWAYIVLLQSPHQFYDDQIPGLSLATISLPPQARLLIFQLGNIYLLLALLATVCCWTTNKKVARSYLIVVALADLGHVWAVYHVLGREKFLDVGAWNEMTWGNVGMSAFLHINRLATVIGVFGRFAR
jgi:hypothetical protein